MPHRNAGTRMRTRGEERKGQCKDTIQTQRVYITTVLWGGRLRDAELDNMASNLDPIETSGAHQMNEILGRLNKLKSNERVVSGDTQEYGQENGWIISEWAECAKNERWIEQKTH
ncbi:hypothetical protein B0H13DRAFT_1882705 [Mycena leptocephala]|nr:hypothetical protein B0H13DRAFT_1882705 [Mycena leptocephala]